MSVETGQMAKCPVCGYPIIADYPGQSTVCANCQTPITAQITDISIPTPLFVGAIAFIFGVILGPSVTTAVKESGSWLERRTRSKLGG